MAHDSSEFKEAVSKFLTPELVGLINARNNSLGAILLGAANRISKTRPFAEGDRFQPVDIKIAFAAAVCFLSALKKTGHIYDHLIGQYRAAALDVCENARNISADCRAEDGVKNALSVVPCKFNIIETLINVLPTLSKQCTSAATTASGMNKSNSVTTTNSHGAKRPSRMYRPPVGWRDLVAMQMRQPELPGLFSQMQPAR
jgi:hypothetical protein